jgi:hypothetical protein
MNRPPNTPNGRRRRGVVLPVALLVTAVLAVAASAALWWDRVQGVAARGLSASEAAGAEAEDAMDRFVADTVAWPTDRSVRWTAIDAHGHRVAGVAVPAAGVWRVTIRATVSGVTMGVASIVREETVTLLANMSPDDLTGTAGTVNLGHSRTRHLFVPGMAWMWWS